MATILKVENKTTSTGKPMKNITLDEPVLGKKYFNIFTFHSRYADVTEGRAFAPEEFKLNGQYLELIDPDKGVKRPFSGGAKNNLAIAESQERKRENIKEAMDNKEYAIKVSGTARDATLITVELMKEDKLSDWPTLWMKTRQKLWDMYEMQKPQDPIY